jgi:TPR repeat protein
MPKSTSWSDEPDLAALHRGYDLIRQDGAAAVRELSALAELGSPMSMVYLGTIYRRGEGGIARDPVQAEKWFRLAADRGSRMGLFDLSILYLNENRHAEAEATLREGAETNYSPAIYWLARLYWRGPAAWRRLPEARALLERASDERHIWAQRDLGAGYLKGTFGFRPIRGAILHLRGAVDFLREFQSNPKSQKLRRDGAWNQ